MSAFAVVIGEKRTSRRRSQIDATAQLRHSAPKFCCDAHNSSLCYVIGVFLGRGRRK